MRGWAGGYRALQEAVRWFAEAKCSRERGPLLRANVMLMRQTVGQLEDLCCDLAAWGIEEITFNPLGGRDRPEFHPDHRLQPDQAEWLSRQTPRLRAMLAERKVRLSGGAVYLQRILANARDEAIPVPECHPGERFLFIDERGIAAPCHFTTQGYGVPVTELQTVADLRALPARFADARRQRRLSACDNCQSTQVFQKFAA